MVKRSTGCYQLGKVNEHSECYIYLTTLVITYDLLRDYVNNLSDHRVIRKMEDIVMDIYI